MQRSKIPAVEYIFEASNYYALYIILLNITAECRVSDFSAWSPCSVSCGKGIRMRSRQYLNAEQALQTKCTRQLVSKEMCVADIPECPNGSAGQDRDEDEGENLANSQSLVTDNGEGAGLCKTTPWSVWSECSATCGIGITMRTRTFTNPLGRKRCPHITIVEKNKCMRPDCTYEQVELPDPSCPTTQWSDWSPCSGTCGRGSAIRKRLVLLEDGEEKDKCTKRMELHQQRECHHALDCNINMEMAKDICAQLPEGGPCRGSYQRYAFNAQSNRCETFTYGGCRGNRNNFLTEGDCLHTCSKINAESNLPRDCVMSEWSNWTTCSVTCGVGQSEGYRYVISEPQNGGQSCPKRLVKTRRCTMPTC